MIVFGYDFLHGRVPTFDELLDAAEDFPSPEELGLPSAEWFMRRDR